MIRICYGLLMKLKEIATVWNWEEDLDVRGIWNMKGKQGTVGSN